MGGGEFKTQPLLGVSSPLPHALFDVEQYVVKRSGPNDKNKKAAEICSAPAVSLG